MTVADLDDPAGLRALDPDDALGDVEAAPAQWRAATRLEVPALDVAAADGVVVAGMGGSGVAADVAQALAAERAPVPLAVHKAPGLPSWVGERSIVVAVSFSGDTAETLDAVEVALARGATVLAVTTGGRLAERATETGAGLVRVPAGPQPRHALGSLTVPVLRALGLAFGLDEAIEVLEQVVAGCGREVEVAANPAKQLGTRLASASVVVGLGAGALGPVAATRLKNQLNENAGLLAHAAALPEAAHNEVAGWDRASAPAGGCAVWLRDELGEAPGLAATVAGATELLAGVLPVAGTVRAVGSGLLARCASLLVQADLVSVYTAFARGVDPTPIANITGLKEALRRAVPPLG